MLQCLRTAGVVHRDFKPENLMINQRGHLVLVDFGSARWLHGDGSTPPQPNVPSRDAVGATFQQQPKPASFVGTAEYTAPETLAGKAPSAAIDLWSFGCILFQMATGRPPFKGPTEFATFERITAGDYELPDDVDDTVADLVRALLVADPAQRLGAASLASLQAHALFDGVEWGEDGRGLWEGAPFEFVPPRPSSPTEEATDWELLSLQSLAEALPVPQYEYKPNPAFFERQRD